MMGSPPEQPALHERRRRVRFGSSRLPAVRGPVLLAAILVASVGCTATESGADATSGTATDAGGGSATVENGTVQISANQLRFDASRIEAPAGEEFTIQLTNQESLPHNVVVFTEKGGEQLSEPQDPVTGPNGTAEYTVQALEPGEYYFECTIHPEMNGTIVVEG